MGPILFPKAPASFRDAAATSAYVGSLLDGLANYIRGLLNVKTVSDHEVKQYFHSLLSDYRRAIQDYEMRFEAMPIKSMTAKERKYLDVIKKTFNEHERRLTHILAKEEIDNEDWDIITSEFCGVYSILGDISLQGAVQNGRSFKRETELMARAVKKGDASKAMDRLKQDSKAMPKATQDKLLQALSAVERLSPSQDGHSSSKGSFSLRGVLRTLGIIAAGIIGWVVLAFSMAFLWEWVFVWSYKWYKMGSPGLFRVMKSIIDVQPSGMNPSLDVWDMFKIFDFMFVLSAILLILAVGVWRREDIKKILKLG